MITKAIGYAGVDPRQCLTAQMQRNYRDPPEKLRSFVEQLLPCLQALPGVQSAAIICALPLENIGADTAILPGQRLLLPLGTGLAPAPSVSALNTSGLRAPLS